MVGTSVKQGFHRVETKAIINIVLYVEAFPLSLSLTPVRQGGIALFNVLITIEHRCGCYTYQQHTHQYYLLHIGWFDCVFIGTSETLAPGS
jgi:hypothetical protein